MSAKCKHVVLTACIGAVLLSLSAFGPAEAGVIRLFLRGGPAQVGMGGFHAFNRSETDWDLYHPVFMLDREQGEWTLSSELEEIVRIEERGVKKASLRGFKRQGDFIVPVEGLKLPITLGGQFYYSETRGVSNLDGQYNENTGKGQGSAFSVAAKPNDTYSIGAYFGGGETVSKGYSEYFFQNSIFTTIPRTRMAMDNDFRGLQLEVKVDERTWLGFRREEADWAFYMLISGDGSQYGIPFKNELHTGEWTLRHNIGPKFSLLMSASRTYGFGIDTFEYDGVASIDDQQLSWIENDEFAVSLDWRKSSATRFTAGYANSYGSLHLSGFINPYLLDKLTFAQCTVGGCGFVYNLRAKYSRRVWQLGMEHKVRRRTTVRTGLTAMPLAVNGFGFGKESFLFGLVTQTVSESQSRATLASWTIYGLTLGVKYESKRGWTVEYTIAQLVPIGNKDEPKEQGLNDPFETPPGVERTSDGGRLHIVSLRGPFSLSPRWDGLEDIPRDWLEAELWYQSREITPPDGFSGMLDDRRRGMRVGLMDKADIRIERGELTVNEDDFDTVVSVDSEMVEMKVASVRDAEFKVFADRKTIAVDDFYDWLTFQTISGPRSRSHGLGLRIQGNLAGTDCEVSWETGRLKSGFIGPGADYQVMAAGVSKHIKEHWTIKVGWERGDIQGGESKSGWTTAATWKGGPRWGLEFNAGLYPNGLPAVSNVMPELAGAAYLAANDARGGYGPILATALTQRVSFTGLKGFYKYEF